MNHVPGFSQKKARYLFTLSALAVLTMVGLTQEPKRVNALAMPKPMVLGDQVMDLRLSATAKGNFGKFDATPVFDSVSGNYAYTFDFSRKLSSRNGFILVSHLETADGLYHIVARFPSATTDILAGVGKVTSDPVFIPAEKYRLSYYSKPYGAHTTDYVILRSIFITPPPVPTQPPTSLKSVYSPAKGDSWALGSSQTIKWIAPADLPTVSVEVQEYNTCVSAPPYPCDPAAPATFVIATSTPNTGNLAWTVGNYSTSTPSNEIFTSFPTGQYQIVVSNTLTSDPFNIVNNTGQPAVRVGQLVYSSGTVYYVGQKGLYGIPSLEVFKSWGWDWSQVVQINASELALGQVGIVPSRDPACPNPVDQINAKCGTAASTITVTSPNGGESWPIGSSQTIKWSAPSSISAVNIDIQHYAAPCTGQLCPLVGTVTQSPRHLAKNVSNNGSFNYTVDKDVDGNLITLGKYIIIVSDANNPGNFGQSQNPFSVTAAPGSQISINTTDSLTGTVGQAFFARFAAAPAGQTYTYSVSGNGPLPAGLHFKPAGYSFCIPPPLYSGTSGTCTTEAQSTGADNQPIMPNTLELSGIPTAAGSVTFTINASDPRGQTASKSFTVVIINGINPPPNLTPFISSLTPSSGPVGTQVTITGTGFLPTSGNMGSGTGGNTIQTTYQGMPVWLANNLNSSDGKALTFQIPDNLIQPCPAGLTAGPPPWPACDPGVFPFAPGVYSIFVSNANGTSNPQTFTVTSPVGGTGPVVGH